MKIKKITIDKYKAFYGKEEFNIDGKNIFIYGENGSGKSSFYYALKDFFQSSNEEVNLAELKNIFLDSTSVGEPSIEVVFQPDQNGAAPDLPILLSDATKAQTQITPLRDAIKLKSFLTYKHLLGIHNIKKGNKIDIFDLLVNGVLKHFKYTLTKGKELGELWQDVIATTQKTVGRGSDSDYLQRLQKKAALNSTIKIFNDAFGELFNKTSIEYILKYAQPILNEFNYDIEVLLDFRKTKALPGDSGIENNHVYLDLLYHGVSIKEPHLFLNEAKLSAIAISIYLGLIKRHLQLIPIKVLFLDDIFIGLDIANRLPLLKILKNQFPDYQIFMTTYDRPWYEYAKFYIEDDPEWKCFELYCKESDDGFDIPVKIDQSDRTHIEVYIQKSEDYYKQGDYKASAVYLRTAFEYTLKKYCLNRIPINFKLKLDDYESENFYDAINKSKSLFDLNFEIQKTIKKVQSALLKEFKGNIPDNINANFRVLCQYLHNLKLGSDIPITINTQKEVREYKKLVLNPMSHSSIDKYGLKSELKEAIRVIKTLNNELNFETQSSKIPK